MDRPTLYLIDGYALIYRAFFAFVRNPLRTSAGEETGAAFGMAQFLVKVLDERQPDYWAVVLDTRGRTARHERFADYKATRQKMPDELTLQIPRILQIFEAFRIPTIEVPGEEADDVIGTLARKGADEEGLDVYVVSGDKDFYQLIDDHLYLFNPGRGGQAAVEEEVIGVAEAPAKFGVGPELVTDVLALMGDASDNIPGIPGVGLKTAQKLVTEWGGLDEIYASLDRVGTPKMREKLAEHRADAFLSKELVTIRTDLEIDLDLGAFQRKEPDRRAVMKVFSELEFHRLAQRFGGGAEEIVEEAEYRIVDTEEKLDALIGILRGAGRFSFDLETTSLDPLAAEICGIAFATQPGKAWYVPVGHASGLNLDRGMVLAKIGRLLEDPEISKIAEDVKYNLLVLHRHGIDLQGLEVDVMVAAYVLEPGRRQYGLEVLALDVLGHRMIAYEEITRVEGQKKPLPFECVPIEAAARYACEDADVTLRLGLRFLEELEAKGLMQLYREVELPLIPVLADIEARGIALDRDFFARMSERLGGELATLERECYVLAGDPFNLNSPPQLAHVLFEKLGLPVVKRTKTGYSTDSEVLETLAASHDLPRRILEYRELAKLKSTYIDALPAAVNAVTGRVHSSWNQAVAESGRLSSSDPNLQNIPARTPLGREIRRGFIPSEPGWLLLVSDYSQIELRILAHLSRDEALMDAFRTGADIHRQTAALVFGLDPEEVTSALRTRAKEVNFGVIYGMGPFGLARRLGIPRDEARKFIEGYFERFQGVRRYQEDSIRQVKSLGYVTTLLGRRRYLPEIQSKNFNVRAFAERAAINSPIQGTAADLLKLAMIRIHRRLAEDGVPARLLLTVHDELVFEVEEPAAEELGRLVKAEMEGAIELVVPVVVEIGVGPTWYEAK
jgi:DNA polymerase-1